MSRIGTICLVLGTVAGLAGAAEARSITWSAPLDALTMDPHALNNTFSLAVVNHMYEGLVQRNAELGIDPGLATSWELLSPTIWRFKLREGVKFHDGAAFDADDVVFSFVRSTAPGALARGNLNNLKEIRKVDAHTVDIETRTPFPILLSALTNFMIMDEGWTRANNAESATDLQAGKENHASRFANGTGPFVLKSREADTRTVMVRNAAWWNKPQHNLDEAHFVPIKSDATRTSALLSGQVDAVLPIALQDIGRVESNPAFQVIQGPELRTIYYGFDHFRDELLYSSVKGKNPFKDIRVRQAFYQAIDVEAIRRTIMRNSSAPAGVMLSPYLAGHPKELNGRLPYDPVKAKALMVEAGYPDGFSVGLACPTDRYVNDEKICQATAAMLARIGVKIEPQFEPAARWSQRLNTNDVSMFMLGHAALPTVDAYSTMTEVIGTRTERQGGLNAGRYSNPKFDALLVQVQAETDLVRRNALIGEAMAIEKADIAHIPLHQQPIAWAARKGIELKQAPDNVLRLWYVTVP